MKTVFTTGEAAEVCKVSQQTIIRCFDSGRLTGFRVPGSKFRRIPRDELIRFMRANSIILDYMLPDINGNIVCERIRSKDEYANTRIIFVSGVVNQEEVRSLLKA